MKNKFGYIALILNILLALVNSSPLWLVFLFGEGYYFGLWTFVAGIDYINFWIFPVVVLMMIFSIILLTRLSFKNKENFLLRVLNIFLIVTAFINLFYIYVLTITAGYRG